MIIFVQLVLVFALGAASYNMPTVVAYGFGMLACVCVGILEGNVRRGTSP